MASLEDLKSVLKETLEQRGVLGDIKARIRAEIFTVFFTNYIYIFAVLHLIMIQLANQNCQQRI